MKKFLAIATLCLTLFACKKGGTEPEPETPATIVGDWHMITHQANVYDSANKFLGIEPLYLENISFTADGKLIEHTIDGGTYTSAYTLKVLGGKNYMFITSTNSAGGTYTDQYEITGLTAHQLDFTSGTFYSNEPFPYRAGILDKVSYRIVATR